MQRLFHAKNKKINCELLQKNSVVIYFHLIFSGLFPSKENTKVLKIFKEITLGTIPSLLLPWKKVISKKACRLSSISSENVCTLPMV